MIYEPAEDSYLLAKCVPTYAKGRVLDMGTGSGIQAFTAAKTADSVIAADINLQAVVACNKNAPPNVKCIHSDLFEKVEGTFDLIIFNPPYLPFDDDKMLEGDEAIYGGEQGYEVIERFLQGAQRHLTQKGKILLLFTSLTKPQEVKHIMKKYGFSFKLIATEHVSFEDLYVYELS